jgi:hypothetical protein
MAARSYTTSREAAIWERAIRFDEELSSTAARALLNVRFAQSDVDRMHDLAAKARVGSLTDEEERETDVYERLGCLLDILHSKARRSLKRRRKAS